MSPFAHGFVDEFIKCAGLLGSVGKLVTKHPVKTLGGAALLGITGVSARNAYNQGLGLTERPRFLQAAPGAPSEAHFTNFHELFPHELSEKQKAALSKNVKPELMKT